MTYNHDIGQARLRTSLCTSPLQEISECIATPTLVPIKGQKNTKKENEKRGEHHIQTNK